MSCKNAFGQKFLSKYSVIVYLKPNTLSLSLTLSLWRGKKYDSSGVSTYLYYFCISQSKVSKIPHNALLSKSDLIWDTWEFWDYPFNQSREGWGQISPLATNHLYDPHTSKRWQTKWQYSLFSIKIIKKNSKKNCKSPSHI